MKVKTILAKAAKCSSDRDAHEFLSFFRELFTQSKPINEWETQNDDYMLEDSGLFTNFELVRILSDYYAINITPEIRDGTLSIFVRLDNFLDGWGSASQSWEAVEGLPVTLVLAEPDQTIAQVVKTVVHSAQENHSQLLQRLGVPATEAARIVKKIW